MSQGSQVSESNHASMEIAATVSYHDNESEDYRNGSSNPSYRTEEDVPSHFRIVINELCSCRNKHLRIVKSKGALLVLIISGMVNISFNGALDSVLRKTFRDFLGIEERGYHMALRIIFIRSIPQLAYPFAGWLADVKFGRFKVLLVSLWLMFAGYAVILMYNAIAFVYNDDSKATRYISSCLVFPVAFLTINMGLAAFQANIIPFGLDQMPQSSTNELSAFIYWYYGMRNIIAGLVPLIGCLVSDFSLSTVITTSCEIACISFALVLCYTLKAELIIEPHSINPFKLVYGVLKYAYNNKVPQARSAFTFWEDEIPSRINLGKSKYGGPYSNEEVENVKTFIRTTIIMIGVCSFMISYLTLMMISSVYSAELQPENIIPIHFKGCSNGLFFRIVLDTFPIVLMIVIYEVFIYPFFKVIIPSMLKCVGIGMAIAILGLLVLLSLDVYGQKQLLDSTEDMMVNRSSNTSSFCNMVSDAAEPRVNLSIKYISITIILGALAEMLVFIATLEFITAQSPYGMRGMLIGAFYCIRGIYGSIAALLFIFFTLAYKSQTLSMHKHLRSVNCEVPLLGTVVVVACLGLVAFIIMSRKHTRRERDEQFDTRKYAEKYYWESNTNTI